MTETVLVTGGTGYVAGWCIVELLQRGYAVRTTVRTLSRNARFARRRLRRRVRRSPEFPAADLTGDEGWDAAVAGCDYVLHVASPLGLARSGIGMRWSARRATERCGCCAPRPGPA